MTRWPSAKWPQQRAARRLYPSRAPSPCVAARSKKGLQRIRIEDFATSLQSRVRPLLRAPTALCRPRRHASPPPAPQTANLDSLSIDESHLNKIIDLRPFMNPAPYVVRDEGSLIAAWTHN